MINYFTGHLEGFVAFIGIMSAFVLTCFAVSKFAVYLPKDMGRTLRLTGKSPRESLEARGSFLYLFFVSRPFYSEKST